MASSIEQISSWFDRAVANGATHMLVVCDTFDYGDFPVFVMPGEDVHEMAKNNNGPNMTRLMEVYAMHLPKAPQLAELRSRHYEKAPS